MFQVLKESSVKWDRVIKGRWAFTPNSAASSPWRWTIFLKMLLPWEQVFKRRSRFHHVWNVPGWIAAVLKASFTVMMCHRDTGKKSIKICFKEKMKNESGKWQLFTMSVTFLQCLTQLGSLLEFLHVFKFYKTIFLTAH